MWLARIKGLAGTEPGYHPERPTRMMRETPAQPGERTAANLAHDALATEGIYLGDNSRTRAGNSLPQTCKGYFENTAPTASYVETL